ncbi:MAG TPA: C13 family peptidase [Xanthobacteraceae bacterium]|nr:C13 family peptidase [Xanthobacteraceae bacterium]
MWSVCKLAARAAIWRTTLEPRRVGLPTLLGWALVLAAVRVALQYLAAGPSPNFTPYGFNAVVTSLAIELAIAALFVPPGGRATALSAMFALSIAAELVIDATTIVFPLTSLAAPADISWPAVAKPMAIFAVVIVWWIGAMVAVLRSLAPQRRLSAFGRVAALWVALSAAEALVPHSPVFAARDFDVRNANLWEYLQAQARTRGLDGPAQSEAARFEQSQHALLQAEITRLAPPKEGATNIYTIGIAGWADQDVFIKELDGALAAISNLLPIRGRTLRLVNHRETLESTPIANQRNFAAAVHGVGGVMNKDEDILLLLMTSHGNPSGFALRLPNEVTSELTPQEVAGTLDNEGIRNRIVIVSACFSGRFVPPLASDDSIVLTASDAKSTSFGCATEREWTYFGDAFFKQSLRPGADLRRAFDNARILIQGWELMDRAAPSNPQSHFGPALVAKLKPFFASASAGR